MRIIYLVLSKFDDIMTAIVILAVFVGIIAPVGGSVYIIIFKPWAAKLTMLFVWFVLIGIFGGEKISQWAKGKLR